MHLGSFSHFLLTLFLRLFCSCAGVTVPRSRSLTSPMDVSPSWQSRPLLMNASNFSRTILLSLDLACCGIALLISHMTFFVICHDSSSLTSSEHEKEAKDNRGIHFPVMPTRLGHLFLPDSINQSTTIPLFMTLSGQFGSVLSWRLS